MRTNTHIRSHTHTHTHTHSHTHTRTHTHTYVIAYAALYAALDSFGVIEYIVIKQDSFLQLASSLYVISLRNIFSRFILLFLYLYLFLFLFYFLLFIYSIFCSLLEVVSHFSLQFPPFTCLPVLTHSPCLSTDSVRTNL